MLLALLASGCQPHFPHDEDDLDSGKRPDRSRLVSALGTPSAAERDRPVVVAAHGYGASTYELRPAAEHLRARGVQVSEVLLGGHGTSIEAFSRTDWLDWQAPVLAEYQALLDQGYRNVSILGTSTGGSLWLEALASAKLPQVPRRIVLVAPLVEFAPSNQLIRFVGLADMLGVRNFPMDLAGPSKGHWYRNRPASTLHSLFELTEHLKRQLDRGIALDPKTRVLLIQSKGDPTVSFESALRIRDGLAGLASLDLRLLDSRLHIPVWPDDGTFTPAELQQREELCTAIAHHLTQP